MSRPSNRETQIEQAVARWHPDIQTIVARTGASLAEIQAALSRIEGAHVDVPPIPQPVPQSTLRAAHAAYVRGERTEAVLAGQRLYETSMGRRKRASLRARTARQIAEDVALVAETTFKVAANARH